MTAERAAWRNLAAGFAILIASVMLADRTGERIAFAGRDLWAGLIFATGLWLLHGTTSARASSKERFRAIRHSIAQVVFAISAPNNAPDANARVRQEIAMLEADLRSLPLAFAGVHKASEAAIPELRKLLAQGAAQSADRADQALLLLTPIDQSVHEEMNATEWGVLSRAAKR